MKRLLWLALLLSIPASAQFPDGLVWDGDNFRYGAQTYVAQHKFGYNLDIDTGTDPEDIWSAGGVYAGWLAAADTILVGTFAIGAADSVGGTGARTVRVIGLNSNYDIVEQTAVLAGIDADTLATNLIRVYRAYVDGAGSGGTNALAVSIKDDEGTVLASIPAGYSQTQMAVYTIPNGYKGALVGWMACIEKTGAATGVTFHLEAMNFGSATWRVIDTAHIVSNIQPCIDEVYGVPVMLDAKTDIRLRVEETTVDNAGVHASFDLWQIK